MITEEQLEKALAAAYRWHDNWRGGSMSPSLVIAKLCDEHLDRSGRLLGRVRELARSPGPAANK